MATTRTRVSRLSATGGNSAAFEPAVDYVVVKLPRWPFDKFPSADRSLGVQMKATGEAMAIDREFGSALLKAIRSLEPRGRVRGQSVPEQLRVVGHLAFAVRGGDDQDVPGRGEPVEIHIVECTHHRSEPVRARRGGGVLGHRFGIARLRAVEHMQHGRRTGGSGIVGGTAGEQPGLHTGEEAGEPRPLVVGEGRIEWDERSCHAGTPIVEARTFGTALRANSSS